MADAHASLLSFSGRSRLPVYLQAEVAECGLACLAMIASYHGHKLDIMTLRRKFPASLRGTDLHNLMACAAKLHFNSRPLQLSLEELPQLQSPCILHWDLSHFVVLKKCDGRYAWLHDPAFGSRKMTMHDASTHFSGVALELMPTAEFRKEEEKQRVRLRDFWHSIRAFRGGLVQLLGLSLVLQLLSLMSPFYMQLVVDQAIVNQDVSLLQTLALGFGLLALIGVGLTVLRSWISMYLGIVLSFQVAANMFRHLVRLPADYFARRHMGDIVSRFGSMDPIQEFVTSSFISVVIDGVMAITTLVMIFIYSPLLSVIVLVGLALYAAIRVIAYHPFRMLSEESIVAAAKEDSVFMETIRAAQIVKLFGREQDRLAQWQNRYAESLNVGVRLQKLEISFSTILALLAVIENTLVVYIGAMSVIEGKLSVGMLYAFMAYKTQFTGALTNLIAQAIEFKLLGLHLERLADIALTPIEEGLDGVTEGVSQEAIIKGHIELNSIKYRYAENEPLVLENVDLVIEPGECVAIAGPSGCGKTTLLKLMIGLMNPTEGEVLIDGKNPTQWGLANYRKQIGVVMQGDQLLSGTLKDNISMFDPETDEERIVRVAQVAHIHEDIMQMAMGYDTLVGDMGNSLSGGQQQRLFLARALYHQPRILFMDEATSHLDVHMEATINREIKKLEITRVVVAHRPDTIAMTDRIIRLRSCKAPVDIESRATSDDPSRGH